MTTMIENHRASFDYEILEKFQAGLELTGQEVKSLRMKRGSLEGARVIVRGGEAYIINMEIPPYQPGNLPEKGYDDRRTRRILPCYLPPAGRTTAPAPTRRPRNSR